MYLATSVVFWCLLGAVLWVYFGYPALVVMLARRGARMGHLRKGQADAEGAPSDAEGATSDVELPRVTVVVAAFNEEAVIDDKIRCVLASAYPADRLEIIIASDGSTDGTAAKVQAWSDPRVRFMDLPRGGKTTALNAACAAATGEILVCTDATTELAASTLKTLIAAFADPRVGCVGADLEYVSEQGTAVGAGTGAYWRYERAIRRSEAAVCSMIGCSGALYAVRAAAHRPIHAELDDDFTMPWEVYDQGYVTAYAVGAVSREPTNEEQGADFRMRVRVALRAINALTRRRRYLNPLRYGWFAVQLMSHKWLRYAVPWALLALLPLNVLLVATGPCRILYGVLLAGQAFIYAISLLGGLSARAGWKVPIVHIPYYFMHMNAAALVAWLRFAGGDRAITWDTSRN